MSDLISRQAAIDAILHITNCKSVRELFEYNQEHHLTEMWSGGVNDAIDAVIGVESATDTNVATKVGTNLASLGTDCISRQAAIERFDYIRPRDPMTSDYTHGIDVGIALCKVAIREQPPAQLGTNLAEVGTDCISREQAIETVGWYSCHSGDKLLFADNALRQLPLIQPDIVRCKDCKHWIPYDWMFSEVWQSKNIADYPEDEIGCDCCDMAMKANDFCSRVERRTE